MMRGSSEPLQQPHSRLSERRAAVPEAAGEGIADHHADLPVIVPRELPQQLHGLAGRLSATGPQATWERHAASITDVVEDRGRHESLQQIHGVRSETGVGLKKSV